MVLESMDVQNTATQPHLLHRIVEALYESPLTYGLQGSWLHYRTPEIFINISSRQNLGQARSWTVRVQVRSHEGELLTAAVKSATLEGIGQAVGRLYQLDQQQTTRHESSLTFRDVEAGHYCFSIILPDKEIIIRRMAVGIEDDENGRVEQG